MKNLIKFFNMVTYHLGSNQSEKLHIHNLPRMDLKPVFSYLCNNQILYPYKYIPPILELANNKENEHRIVY